jgi:capsular exopolysaccharide synthesis family protein
VAAIPQIGGTSTSRYGLFSKEQWQELRTAWKNGVEILFDRALPLPNRLSAIHDVIRPSLAMIGHPHMATALPQGGELVVKDDRSGLVAESFRSLRASIAMNARVENQRTFLLTSAHPSEGKSFCSSNFASTLAQQGLKTLLIDSDLRKPSISRIFYGMNRKPGLSEVLLGKVGLADAVNSSEVEGLSVLTAGGRSSRPSELLAGQPLRDLLTEALKTYDRVVIDSAPILAVSDTLLVAPNVDVVCLVVRSFMTPRKMVTRALKALSEIHVQPAGIVFNCLPSGNGAYYAYYYSGKYYGTYGSKGVYGS